MHAPIKRISVWPLGLLDLHYAPPQQFMMWHNEVMTSQNGRVARMDCEMDDACFHVTY